MDSNLNSKNNFNDIQIKNDEIDFKLILNFFNRNKKFLSSISLVCLFLGYFYSFFPKRTWEGQFQIVLNSDEKSDKVGSINPFLKNFSVYSFTNNLETQVGILKSPSVLMPAYELVISGKDYLNKNNYEFSEWKNDNLNIELERDTSILNISYKDQDKDLILPVLNKMSSSYQEYAGKRKNRIDTNSENFLKNQIEIFKEKSSTSLKLAQEFAIDQNLIYIDKNLDESSMNSNIDSFIQDSNNSSNSATYNFVPEYVDIENVRVTAANEIRRIDLQLKKISELNDFMQLQYIGSTIDALNEAGLPQNLQQIEAKLVEARSKYTDEDRSIKRLIKQRDLAIEILKNRSINYLKAKKLDAEARMEAAKRPKGILIKYKELLRNALRDENTLVQLENELRATELSKSRKEEPWELITKPTLLNYPIGNITITSLVFGFLAGLTIGIVIAFFKEKRSEIIFELKELIKFLNPKTLEIVNMKNNDIDEKINYLRKVFDKISEEKICLILIGNFSENKFENFKDLLIKNKKNEKQIQIIKSFENAETDLQINSNFLILEIGAVKNSEIINFKKYQDLLKINIAGSIIIE